MGTKTEGITTVFGEISPEFRYESRCKICKNTEWGPRVTEALIRGITWREIKNRYGKYFENGLRDDTLNVHFKKHCDRRALIRARRLASANARIAFFERAEAEGKELLDSAVAFDSIARNCFDDVMRMNEELDWLNEEIEFYGGKRIFNKDILGDTDFPEAAVILNDPIELQMRGYDHPSDIDGPSATRRDQIVNNLLGRRTTVSKEKDASIKSLIDSLYKRERILGKESDRPQININILQVNFQSFLDSVMRIMHNSVPDTVLRNALVAKIAREMDTYFAPLLGNGE